MPKDFISLAEWSPDELNDLLGRSQQLRRLHADGERILKPLGLDKYGVDDLVAFLESLSEQVGIRAPEPIPVPVPNPAMPLR